MSTLSVDNLKTLSGNGIDAQIVSIGGGHLSNRNIIINGAMTVSQRATSASFTSGGVFPALDRFKAVGNSSMTVNTTISQTADSPDGLGYCYKVLVNASQTPTGSENFLCRYAGEEQDMKRFGYGTSACKQATISFSVKSNKTGLYSVQIYLGNYLPNIIETYTINSANTWERKTITLPTYTTSFTHLADNAIGLMIDWHLADGPDDIVSTTGWQTAAGNARAATGQVNLLDATNNYWQMTNVQFEVGDTATSFEHRSFTEELARCQRYFYMAASGADSNNATVALCMNYSANSARAVFHFPVTMRTTPDIYSVEGTDYFRIRQHSGTSDNPDSIHGGNLRPNMAEVAFEDDVSGMTAGQATLLRINNSAARIGFTAEF